MWSLNLVIWVQNLYCKSSLIYPCRIYGNSLVVWIGLGLFQEEQRQMVVEHLFSSDRNSLLSEIQDLRAQLRMTHLQNQEKLQQLQETLTKAEDHGNKQEHQLRRKGNSYCFVRSFCLLHQFLLALKGKRQKKVPCKEVDTVQFLSLTECTQVAHGVSSSFSYQ